MKLTGIGLFAALIGCGGGAMQQGPSDTLRAYARALDEGRADDAYRLLSTEARQSISLEAFRRMVKESSPEMKEIARSLSRPASDPIVTAVVTSPKGETLHMIYEGGVWRIDAAAIDLYGQETPKKAIESFLRAFDQKRYDVILRLVPDKELRDLTAEKLKKAWEGPQKEEMLRIVADIRAALASSAQLEETADRATMAYGSGGAVLLVREHGAWKIEDFD